MQKYIYVYVYILIYFYHIALKADNFSVKLYIDTLYSFR